MEYVTEKDRKIDENQAGLIFDSLQEGSFDSLERIGSPKERKYASLEKAIDVAYSNMAGEYLAESFEINVMPYFNAHFVEAKRSASELPLETPCIVPGFYHFVQYADYLSGRTMSQETIKELSRDPQMAYVAADKLGISCMLKDLENPLE